MYSGIAASEGIAIGRVLILNKYQPPIRRIRIREEAIGPEIKKFHQALRLSKIQLKELQALSDPITSEVLEMQLMVLDDMEFIDAVTLKIKEENQDALSAVHDTIEGYVQLMSVVEDDYIKERSLDMRDIGHRVLMNLLGKPIPSLLSLEKDVIVVARDITPSETAQMDKSKVLGFITDTGGKTSHAAILARTLGIPAILGMHNISQKLKNDDFICFDGEKGVLHLNPDEETLAAYRQKQHALAEYAKTFTKYKDLPSITLDQHKVEIAANIGLPADSISAKDFGAEGIGLFRTEFLYMGRKNLPSEEEQLAAYREVLENMAGKPVIIRTLDIGGDKSLPYLELHQEMNPFLGYRAIRIGLDQPHLFKTQLRALLRSSIYGDLRIMYPMISSVDEVVAANDLLAECKMELDQEGLAYTDNFQVGAMIEVPSAAICAELIADQVDFFSIGTNDLTQYVCAVDRMNEKVSDLYNPFHPAVLRLIKQVIDVSHQHGIWCGICGETAGDKRLIPLFLGMGLDEFSMNARTVPKARKIIASLRYSDMQKLVTEVMKLRHAKDIQALLEDLAAEIENSPHL